MNSSFRKLSFNEARNERILAQRINVYSLLFVTSTGLKKATFDATESIRSLFEKTGFHEYELQGRGRAENGREGTALFLTADNKTERPVSLFKPKAKPRQSGDPRFWPYGAGKFFTAGDVAALFVFKKRLCFLNLSQINLKEINDESSFRFIDNFLEECEEESFFYAYELVQKLRQLSAAGPLVSAPTDEGVGFAVEQALGLKRNARGYPDYKGKIEIKSGRGRSNTTLFSCRPDWSLAMELNAMRRPIDRYCTSPNSLLHRYGYWRSGRWNLACDVSTQKYNTQYLTLRFNREDGTLIERCRRQPFNVALWQLKELHKRLGEKHPETMFITAQSRVISKKTEQFYLEKAIYVRSPSFSKFDQLLEDGTVKVCHRKSSKDHGVAFRIAPNRASELFLARPKKFDLKKTF